MTTESTPAQFALRCIFCGGAGITKEHIWGRRFGKLLPRKSPNTSHVAGTGQVRGLGRLHRPGDPSSQSLRVVCRDCNVGWMSRLQEASMPAMARLVLGTWEDISDHDFAVTRTALVLTAMVAEWSDPPTVGISFEERQRFRETNVPDATWIVLIGKYHDETQSSVVFNHFYGHGQNDGQPFTFQTTGFTLGRLLVQTLSGGLPSLSDHAESLARLYDLQRLEPLGDTVAPPVISHDYPGFDEISSYVARREGLPVQSFVERPTWATPGWSKG